MADYPSQFGRSEQYRNPEGTLPMPSPGEVPRPTWNGPRTTFRWAMQTIIDAVAGAPPYNTSISIDSTPLAPGVVYGYTWTSPVFDLRPDLRSSQGAPKTGVPMWSSAARLYIQLMADSLGSGEQKPLINTVTAGSITVTARDWVNTLANYENQSAPGDGQTGGAGLQRGPPTNVSALFNVPVADITTRTVLAGFAPPGATLGGGDGYPVRYWRLELGFTCYIETGLPLPVPLPLGNALVFQPSMY